MGKQFLAIVVFSVLAAGVGAAEVRLRSSAGCSAAVVRLADIAEVFADDNRVAMALSDIPLCPAPAAGSQRSLSQHDVRQLLALSGVDSKTALVTGSETVTVMGEASSSASRVRRPLVAAGVRQAAFETDVETSRKPSSRPVIKPSIESVSDKDSEAQPVVERGSAVTVHARTSGVRITTSGKALDAGAVGQSVSVELADSKQRVLAIVTGPQDVEVSVGATSARGVGSLSKAAPADTGPVP